ncbi:TIGR03560 family F420-dependent LLM class oxidoreductase [Blastococcus sp. SYSU D00669]
MRYAIMIEPQQGMSYDDILAVALAAERAGIETFFRSDHYSSFPEAGLATTDAWATTAGLARDTSTVNIGVLVSPVIFRLPGPLAKTAATVHEMSGGRVELGIGAGWHEGEARQFGVPFPPVKERLDRLEEYAAVVRGLWNQPPGWSFEGEYYQVKDALFEPRPDANGRPPIHLIMGGDGKPRSCRLAAQFADEYNVVFATPDRARTAFEGVRNACDERGRDSDELVYSALCGVLIGADEKEYRERQKRQDDVLGPAAVGVEPPEDRLDRWLLGTPEAALERVAALEAVGVQRIVLHDYLPDDLEMIELIGKHLVSA